MRGGGAPTLEARTVTPSTSQQIIKPSRDEYDGLSQVTVEATPLETRTVNPSTSSQTVTPSGSNIGFSTVMVNPYRLQSKSVTPSTSAQTVKPDTGKDGLSQVTVNAIRLQSKSVSPSTNQQIVKPDSSYNGLSQVTVNAVLLQNKSVNPSSSIQYITADDGYYGLGMVTVNQGIKRITGNFQGNGQNSISIPIGSDAKDYNVVSAQVRFFSGTIYPVFLSGGTFDGLAWVDSGGNQIFNSNDPVKGVNNALMAMTTEDSVFLSFLVRNSAFIFGPFGSGCTYEYEFILVHN